MAAVKRTVQPTAGQIMAAFAAERRPGWPMDLSEAMADPLYGRIVTLHAKLLAMGRDPGAYCRVIQRPAVVAPEPPHPAEPHQPSPSRPRAKSRRPVPTSGNPQMPLVDLKRAAAGDAD
jgi:hypothetical protein